MKRKLKLILLILSGLIISGCQKAVTTEKRKDSDETVETSVSQISKTTTEFPVEVTKLYQLFTGEKLPVEQLTITKLSEVGIGCGNLSELDYFEQKMSAYEIAFYPETAERSNEGVKLNEAKEVTVFHYESQAVEEIKAILAIFAFPMPEELAKPLTKDQLNIPINYGHQGDYVVINRSLADDLAETSENIAQSTTYNLSFYHQVKPIPGYEQYVGEKVSDVPEI